VAVVVMSSTQGFAHAHWIELVEVMVWYMHWDCSDVVGEGSRAQVLC
jgi:hypothetical protein